MREVISRGGIIFVKARPIQRLKRRSRSYSSSRIVVPAGSTKEANKDSTVIVREATPIEPGSGTVHSQSSSYSESRFEAASLPLSRDLNDNETVLRGVFEDCSDVVFRTLQLDHKTKLLLIFIDGVVDQKILDVAVLKPLLHRGGLHGTGTVPYTLDEVIRQQLVAITQTSIVSTMQKVVENVVNCNVAVLLHGEDVALILENKAWAERAVEEPAAETVVRGPREGFTESLRTNTSLVRRRLRNPDLKMESVTLGTVTHTNVVIAYMKGIVSEDILAEVRRRIGRIEVDAVLESGYIEELIEDAPFSPFPQIQNTERPDVVASALLDGRIAIIVDGTPFALLIPMTFWMSLEAAEDYYERFMYTSAIRCVRFVFLVMSLFFPSLYVASTTFHPQMLPTQLLLTFASAREPSPLPAVVEALIMEFMFEGLREAGVRLPRAVGSAVSIVGALVIGQAAVQAGIVSASIVIVVASTGIASFAIPRYSFGYAFRLLRFPLLLLAGTLGFYGIAVGLIAIMIHLVSLRSFGVSYLSPVAPLVPRSAKNIILRPPIWSMKSRPKIVTGDLSWRMPKEQGPQPPSE